MLAPPVAPPILQYATTPARRRRRWPVVALVFALPAAVVPFLNFTFSTTPLEAAQRLPDRIFPWNDDSILFLLAASFFIAFPIVAWKARLLLGSPPTRWEQLIAALIAIVAIIPVSIINVRILIEIRINPPELEGFVLVALGVLTFVGGIFLTVLACVRRNTNEAIDALLATGYLSNMALCLYAFHEGPQVGYWLSILPTAALAADLLLTAVTSPSSRKDPVFVARDS